VSVRAWRITMEEHAATAFTGEGAAAYGGRWNGQDVRVVYLAGSAALAVLESLVHLELDDLYKEFVLIEVTFEESLVETVDVVALPPDWQASPPPPDLQRIGDEWVSAARSAVLRVPSVLVEDEWNYVLNPSHPDYTQIVLGRSRPLQFDPRLIE